MNKNKTEVSGIPALEAEIDYLVNQFYGLTDDDIHEVDGRNRP